MRITIEGSRGEGKTTLANKIAEMLAKDNVTVFVNEGGEQKIDLDENGVEIITSQSNVESVRQSTIDRTTQFSDKFEIELRFANGKMTAQELLLKTVNFLEEEVGETDRAIREDQGGPEIVDGFGDVAFVALNGIYKYFRTVVGLSHFEANYRTHKVMDRICSANLAKLGADGEVIFENNKVQKPEGWTAPTFDDLMVV